VDLYTRISIRAHVSSSSIESLSAELLLEPKANVFVWIFASIGFSIVAIASLSPSARDKDPCMKWSMAGSKKSSENKSMLVPISKDIHIDFCLKFLHVICAIVLNISLNSIKQNWLNEIKYVSVLN
jgi:hypothetical protein